MTSRHMPSAERTAAIIVCGGQSSRMGHDKALLQIGSTTFLQRIISTVRQALPSAEILVAAAVDQQLPPLPKGLKVCRDSEPNAGPLEGVRAGLQALSCVPCRVFLTGCDTPLLQPGVISLLFEQSDQAAAVLPVDGTREFPLCSVIHSSLLEAIDSMLASGERRLRQLYCHSAVRRIPVDVLRTADPQLLSLHNVNSADDYQALMMQLKAEQKPC